MAGGLVRYRHLSRTSAHRKALLRNLVTSLVKHESIQTTWAKAKEAQRLADRLITLAKRNNETSRRKVQGILFVRLTRFLRDDCCRPGVALTSSSKTPHELMPKVFNELRVRYEKRPGGYTRVLRTEPKSTYDHAPSALLEFVDSPNDTRLLMTASIVANDQKRNRKVNRLTLLNRKKVTQFRENGKQVFEKLVDQIKGRYALRLKEQAKGQSREDGPAGRD
jgi:large subunit ribosomal protein L17